MLAIGIALLCRPTLLLIDELSLGLAPIVIKELMELMRQIRRELGLTVFLVEQNAKAALGNRRLRYVMERGRIVFSGKAAELKRILMCGSSTSAEPGRARAREELSRYQAISSQAAVVGLIVAGNRGVTLGSVGSPRSTGSV